MRKFLSALTFIVLLASLSSSAYAQTKEDAINAFNKAFNLSKSGTPTEAFNAFKEAADIASKAGETEIKTKAEKQLPALAYQQAVEVYKSKDIAGAIESFKKASEVAEKYGDSGIQSKADNNIPKLYVALGSRALKQGNTDEAIAQYQAAIDYDPTNTAAMLNMAIAYKTADKKDESIATIDKILEIDNNGLVARKAKRTAAENLVFWGATATQAKNYSQAKEYLEKALTYDAENADAYYRLAESANKQGQFTDAKTYANKAIGFEKGSKVAKAKIYFELGMAEMNLGNKTAACTAFKSAAFGDFKQSAEHQMEHVLKCGE